MVQFTGTYKLASQENYKEYIISLGADEEKAAKVAEHREDVIVSEIDSEFLTAKYSGQSIKYPLNKEIEQSLPGGHKVWTTTSVNGNVITFKTKLDAQGQHSEEKVSVFTDDGIVITSTNSKGVKCVRKYKRA